MQSKLKTKNHVLDELETLPALQELELSLNGISSSNSFSFITHTSFPNLLILDLSYNNLGNDAITALGLLPALQDLHLTGEKNGERERGGGKKYYMREK